MRVIRKEKKNKNKKKLVEQKKIFNPWKVRSKKYSEYPYIVTVSFFRKNVFLSASDLRGRIKYWTNAGRLGFKGVDKTQYMAIVTVAEAFFKKLSRYGIRDIFLKFKNYKRSRNAIKKAIKNLKLTGRKERKAKIKLRKKKLRNKLKNKLKYKLKKKTSKIKLIRCFKWKLAWVKKNKKWVKEKKRIKVLIRLKKKLNKWKKIKKLTKLQQRQKIKKLTKLQQRQKLKKLKRLKWLKNKKLKKRKGSRKLRFLGIWTELHVSFNGCRNKKEKRKRHRRKAKKIFIK